MSRHIVSPPFETAATPAANGAIKGAGEVGVTAADQVTQALTGVTDGVKTVVTEPVRPLRPEGKASRMTGGSDAGA